MSACHPIGVIERARHGPRGDQPAARRSHRRDPLDPGPARCGNRSECAKGASRRWDLSRRWRQCCGSLLTVPPMLKTVIQTGGCRCWVSRDCLSGVNAFASLAKAPWDDSGCGNWRGSRRRAGTGRSSCCGRGCGPSTAVRAAERPGPGDAGVGAAWQRQDRVAAFLDQPDGPGGVRCVGGGGAG